MNMKCTWGRCPREATFGWKDKSVEFCDLHRHPWMVDTSTEVVKTNPLAAVNPPLPPIIHRHEMANSSTDMSDSHSPDSTRAVHNFNHPYRVAILGERASGKTAFVRMVKGIPLSPIKENRYHATPHTEVHPIDHRGTFIDLWETGKFSIVEKFPLTDAIIVISRHKQDERVSVNMDSGKPILTVNNRHYSMTHDDVINALDELVKALP